MRKRTIIWLCLAALLVLLGLGLLTFAMAANGWDVTKLDTTVYETNTYEIGEDFHDLTIYTDTADVFFARSEDGTCKVVCREESKVKHTVFVQNGVLTVQVKNEKEWFDFIGFGLEHTKITIYLPNAEYGNLHIVGSTGDVQLSHDFRFDQVSIGMSTGHIHLDNISAKMIELSASTGDIIAAGIECEADVAVYVSTGRAELSDVVCRNVKSTGSTGDISLKRVLAEEGIHIERSTGDVVFDESDDAEIYVRGGTGDVKGSLLTGKTFSVKTSTGSIDVPQSVTGGMCEIFTTTGDVHLTIG